ncbi:MAG: type II toxin-antitoxin system VapC family toxin [Candidatus Baldrarchaeia archaeon]
MRYVDVNVFVYWLTSDPKFGGRATEIIKRIEKGEKALTSTLTVWLTHIVLKNATENYSEENLLKSFKELTGLKIVDLTFKDFEKALTYSKEYNLDLEDSIHFAVAIRFGIREIYSNDEDFDKTPLKRIF